MKNIYVYAEAKSGATGKKVFENRAEALTWLNEKATLINRAAIVEEFIAEGAMKEKDIENKEKREKAAKAAKEKKAKEAKEKAKK